jgi:hypothetical protein
MSLGPAYQSAWPEPVLTRVVVLSSGDKTASDTASDFALSLPSRVYDVLGIRLAALDVAYTSTTSPPQPTEVYVRFNDLRHVTSPNTNVDGAFAYVLLQPTLTATNGATYHLRFDNRAPAGLDDPCTYLFSPASSAMDKVRLQLVNPDGSLYNAQGAVVTYTFVFYTRYVKEARL